MNRISHMSAERWQKLSFVEQMANIGSEVYRSINWSRRKDDRFQAAFERALELFYLTADDKRWIGRYKEITRSRDMFCTLLLNPENYKKPEDELDFLNRYFLEFAMCVRNRKD